MSTHSSKMTAGDKFPTMQWKSVSGGAISPADASGWRILIVYRGKHCPLCKAYLNGLNTMLADFQKEQIDVSAISADPLEKAQQQVAELGWKFPVGYDLSVEQMRTLGLYVSRPRSPEETDRMFAEPGLFVVNPQGDVQIIDLSNAPFARPDLKSLLGGLQFVIGKGYPVRGTA